MHYRSLLPSCRDDKMITEGQIVYPLDVAPQHEGRVADIHGVKQVLKMFEFINQAS